MKCSRCGHDNDSDALYCVECGLVLNGAHSCKACHNWLNPGYKYCIYCGKKQGTNVAKIAGISTLVVVLLAVALPCGISILLIPRKLPLPIMTRS